jgi:hypothetical protein
MTKESIIESLYDSLEQIDPKQFIAYQVENYTNLSDVQTASIDLSAFLAFQYDHDKEEDLATIMYLMLKANRDIGLINFPENNFFKIALITGSFGLLDVYLTQIISYYLENKSIEEWKSCYTKLLKKAIDLSQLFMTQYDFVIKGIDYQLPEKSEKDLLILSKKDHEEMQDTIDKFNKIVGRKKIMDELVDRIKLAKDYYDVE